MGQNTAVILDRLYGEFLNQKVEPCIVSRFEKEGFTIVDASAEAFTLEPPVASRLTMVQSPDSDKDQIGLIRQIIGLAHASRISVDFNQGMYSLALLKNSMLVQAAEQFNFSPIFGKYDWTFQYPNGTYFRDCDNVAGYEIRLYISKRKVD